MQDAHYDNGSASRVMRGRERKLAGVCSGLGAYFDVDPTLVRLAFVVLALMTAVGGALLIYVVLWIVLPAPDAAGADTASAAGAHGASAPRGDAMYGTSNGRMALAVVLLVLGLLAIGDMSFAPWTHEGFFRFSWPVALFVVGALLVVVTRRRR